MTRRLVLTLVLAAAQLAAQRWTRQAAEDWYAHQPWLVGANYNPTNAINELEMWQADTFDPATVLTDPGDLHDRGRHDRLPSLAPGHQEPGEHQDDDAMRGARSDRSHGRLPEKRAANGRRGKRPLSAR